MTDSKSRIEQMNAQLDAISAHIMDLAHDSALMTEDLRMFNACANTAQRRQMELEAKVKELQHQVFLEETGKNTWQSLHDELELRVRELEAITERCCGHCECRIPCARPK